MARLETVTIIHGKGTGILKEGLARELKRNKHVASIRIAEYNEGGGGATVVTMKK